MRDVNFSELAESIIKDRAIEIVDNATTKTCDFTREDLINLVVELLKDITVWSQN